MFGFGEEAKPTAEVPATPAAPETPAAPVEEPKGLDKWAGLLDNDKTDEKLGEAEKPTTIFNPNEILADEEAVTALLSKTDFTSNISPETQQKLADGAPDAMLALNNDIGKQVYLQAMRHTTALVDRQMNERFAAQEGVTSSKINSSINDKDLAKLLPEITNPIIALGVQPFIDKLRAQNPSMSTADVAAQTKEYLGDLNNKLNAPPPDPKKDEEVDWMEGLDFNP
jgi:hypothetical protein